MYTEDNLLTLAVVFRKNGMTEGRKSIVKWKYNTLRKHQVVIKQNNSSHCHAGCTSIKMHYIEIKHLIHKHFQYYIQEHSMF